MVTPKKLILLICLVKLLVICQDDSYYQNQPFDYIQNRDLAFYQTRSTQQLQEQCAMQELHSYSLYGDAQRLGETNTICPKITQNCCGKLDQKNILKYWQKDTKNQGLHVRAYLLMNRYMLGFGKQYGQIANEYVSKYKLYKNSAQYKQKHDQLSETTANFGKKITLSNFCYQAAKKVIRNGFTQKYKIESFYFQLTRKQEFYQNIRRGFYCSLCSAKFKQNVRTNRFPWENLIHNRIYFSENLCNTMYWKAFDTTYLIYKGYNQFLKNVLKTFQCVKQNDNEMIQQENPQSQENTALEGTNFDVLNDDKNYPRRLTLNQRNPYNGASKNTIKLIKNPLGITNKFLLRNCFRFSPDSIFFMLMCGMKFCGHFRMTKSRPLYDGDLYKTFIAFKQLESYEGILMNKKYNQFNDDVIALKMKIKRSFNAVEKSKYFFKPVNEGLDFANYYSSFWLKLGHIGINPLEDADGSALKFFYKQGVIVRIGMIVGLMFLALF